MITSAIVGVQQIMQIYYHCILSLLRRGQQFSAVRLQYNEIEIYGAFVSISTLSSLRHQSRGASKCSY